jgi:hypothetical protein
MSQLVCIVCHYGIKLQHNIYAIKFETIQLLKIVYQNNKKYYPKTASIFFAKSISLAVTIFPASCVLNQTSTVL